MTPRERRSTIARPALCSVITAPHRSTSLQYSGQLTHHSPQECSRGSSLPSRPIYFSIPAHLLALEVGPVHLTERRGTAAAAFDARNSMTNPTRTGTRCVSTMLSVAATLLIAGAATAQETSPAEGGVALDLDVVAKQLDIARQQIQPSLGATVYDFGRQAIETQPQGDNQSFNRLLLQAPGVTQDSFGQLHVRNEHANTQFRINGRQLPEGINGFGQALQTRHANPVALVTGSLPAHYS